MRTNKKYDVSIELARLLACLIVVGVHVHLTYLTGDTTDFSKRYIGSLLADGVAIFWVISGCFFFKNTDYKKVLLRTSKRILFPVLLLSLVCFYFYYWLSGQSSLLDSVHHSFGEYFEFIRGIISFSGFAPSCAHLWYCYTYVLLIFAFPIFQTFVAYLDEDEKREKWFLLLSFGFILLNDLLCNELAMFSHRGLTSVVPAAIFVIWGHILYRHKEKFLFLQKSKYRILLLICFFVFNFVRQLISYNAQNLVRKPALSWYSSFGLIITLCVILFCFSIENLLKEKPAGIICKLSSYTFPIYLFHMPVLGIIGSRGNALITKFMAIIGTNGILSEVTFMAVLTILIFLISLICSMLLRFSLNLLKRIF